MIQTENDKNLIPNIIIDINDNSYIVLSNSNNIEINNIINNNTGKIIDSFELNFCNTLDEAIITGSKIANNFIIYHNKKFVLEYKGNNNV